MAYVQDTNGQLVPKFRKSFIEVATAEILDTERTTEPKDFKKNYPHYDFSDDTSLAGSTRFDTSFKHHGADELKPSDKGLAKVCLPTRPKKVIAVAKQKIQDDCCCCEEPPKPYALKPRPYTPANTVINVPHCKPIKTIVDNIPHIKAQNETLWEEIEANCSNCYATEEELKAAIAEGKDPYDGMVVGSVENEEMEAVPAPVATGTDTGSKPKRTRKPKADAAPVEPKEPEVSGDGVTEDKEDDAVETTDRTEGVELENQPVDAVPNAGDA